LISRAAATPTLRAYQSALRAAGINIFTVRRGRRRFGKIRDRYAWREEQDPARLNATVRVMNARQANRVITTLSILLS
jgi:hypothetical protein